VFLRVVILQVELCSPLTLRLDLSAAVDQFAVCVSILTLESQAVLCIFHPYYRSQWQQIFKVAQIWLLQNNSIIYSLKAVQQSEKNMNLHSCQAFVGSLQ